MVLKYFALEVTAMLGTGGRVCGTKSRCELKALRFNKFCTLEVFHYESV